MNLHELLDKYGILFSERLGIRVEEEPFKWLLASILFGARISINIAEKTYNAYMRSGLSSPQTICEAPRSKLIQVHGEGGYDRYDGITADYMKGVAEKVIREYGGEVKRLDEVSRSPRELEERLLEFKGIGPITVNIFLRELRGVWRNADPAPTPMEIEAARRLGFIKGRSGGPGDLKEFWERNRVEGCDFRNFETALVRIGLRFRRGKGVE